MSTFDEINIMETFDFINMSHVLEHLFEPKRVLQKCFNMLAPGGELRLSIPNIDSLESRFFGRNWMGLDIPRHIVHFRAKVIKKLLQECGFEHVNIRPQMFASSISESLILLSPGGGQLLGTQLARILYLATIFPASLSYLLGNAGAVEIKAQKP